MQIQLIVIMLVALVLILLTVQNPNPVPVQFLGWDTQQIPLVVIMLVSALAGMIVSALLGVIKHLKFRETIHRLEKELEDLKHPPISSPDDIADE